MSELMTIEAIQSFPVGIHREDGFFVNLPYVGVVDAYSSPYYGKPPLVSGMTGGESIKNLVLEVFQTMTSDIIMSLEEIVMEIVDLIKRRHQISSFPGTLPGASFAFGLIEKETIKIILGGDCAVLQRRKNGETSITENQFYEIEVGLRKKFAELIKECGGDKEEAWKEFCPVLEAQRKRDVNRKYASLNGQDEVRNCWQKLEVPIAGLDFLMFFTDGLVPFGEWKDKKMLEKILASICQVKGPRSILSWVRRDEIEKKGKNHVDYSEATALLIGYNLYD